METFVLFLIFEMHLITRILPFPLWRVAGTAAQEGLEPSHGQQQSQMVLLAPHQDMTKQGQRYNHYCWFLHDIWATARGCRPQTCLPNHFWDIPNK